MKNINILKRKCQVGINVVFLELILKLYDVCFMKNIFIAPWTCLHRPDLHIIIRWPNNVRRVNKICLHCGHNKFSWYNVDQGNWALYATVELSEPLSPPPLTISLPKTTRIKWIQLEHRIWRNLTIQLGGCLFFFCNELIK